MEKINEADVLRKFRRISNNIIHSNPMSNRFSLSTPSSEKPVLDLGKPSGMLDIPICYTLISMSAMIIGLLRFWNKADLEKTCKKYINIIDRIMKKVRAMSNAETLSRSNDECR